MRISDWSSDVCSSDLEDQLRNVGRIVLAVAVQRRDPRRPRGLDAGMDGGALAGIADVADEDRKSVVSGKSVPVRVDLGGRRILKKKRHNTHITAQHVEATHEQYTNN